MSDDKSKGWLPCKYGRDVSCDADADPAEGGDARLGGAEEEFGGGAAADAEETPCRWGFGGGRLFVRGLERPMAQELEVRGELRTVRSRVESRESKSRCEDRRRKGIKEER